ncbi:MAG: BamA/TamA family outer membrane protein [Chitinophagaceae bacterium]
MKKVFLQVALWMMVTLPAMAQQDSAQAASDTLQPQQQSLINRLLNKYTNDTIVYAKKGFFVKPSLTFGVGYRIQKAENGQAPFDAEHSLTFNYVINRGGLFVEYKSLWYRAIGSWNLGLLARTDLPDVVNFHGIGNESGWVRGNNRFYRLRTSEILGGISINKLVDSTHLFEFQHFYQSVKIKLDKDRIISDKNIPVGKTDFTRDHFAGAQASYFFSRRNNQLAPTRGFEWNVSGAYVHNLKNTERHFTHFISSATAYLPLHRNLTLALRAGGEALQGEPEFYQLGTLGGSENLRGYRRQRFYGKTAFYNNNELRWLRTTGSKLFHKVGVLGFVDQGRVWQPGETSDTWHVGYGGGLVIIPFNKIVLNGTIGTSKEATIIHARIGYLF